MGKRFLDGFYVSRSDARMASRMVLRIVKHKRERSDTITELLKYLRYRYELSERALAHHAKLAADAMIGKLLGGYHDFLLRACIDERAASNKALRNRLEGISRADVGAMAQATAAQLGENGFQKLRDVAREQLENLMLTHGDDGLLERLRADMEALARDDALAQGIGEIASDVLERRLYGSIGRFDDRAHAERLWKDFGRDPDRRRIIERDVARYAELEKPRQVALWISPEHMRLKPALVLVDDDDMVDTMLKRESSPHGSGRGVDIYEAHRKLWSLEIFVHRGLRERQEEVPWLQAAFATRLELKAWSDPRLPVAVDEVARERLADDLRLTRAESQRLAEGIPSFYEGSGAPDAIGGEATRSSLVDELRELADKQGFRAASELPQQDPPLGDVDDDGLAGTAGVDRAEGDQQEDMGL